MTAYTTVLGRKNGFQPDFNHNFLLRYSSASVLRIGEEQDGRRWEMLPAAILFYWPPGEFMMDRVEHVNYSNMITLLFQTVPEAKIAYKLWEMPGEPLPYIVFSFLEESFFTPLVNSVTDDELKWRVFRFFERMAASRDAKVVDLLAIGLFEAWATNGAIAASFERMGPRTKVLARKAVKSTRSRIFLD